MNKKKTAWVPALVLAVLMLLTSAGYAGFEPMEAALALNRVSVGNGSYSQGILRLDGSGRADGEAFFPFPASGLRVAYSAPAETRLTVALGESVQKAETVLDSGTKTVDIPFNQTEYPGIRTISLEADGAVEIMGLTALKQRQELGWGGYVEVQYTADEEALRTAGVLMTDSPLSLVRNARRYINSQRPAQTAVNKNGVTYVPADFLIELLNVYVEMDGAKQSVLVRNDDISMLFTPDGCTVSANGQTRTELLGVEKLCCTYALPLRFVAQTFGKTVDYKDGLIVIDEPYRINGILNDDPLLERVRARLQTSDIAGRTLHVSQNHKNANDTNGGTEDMPFKTINAATASARAGDRIIVHSGIYRETVQFPVSGQPGAPITLEGADGEDVTVSAADEITKAARYKENIYLASAPNALADNKNLVFCNGDALAEARHPNVKNNDSRADISHLGLSPLWGVEGDISAKDPAQPYLFTAEKSLNQTEKDYWKGATFIGLVHEGWRRSMAKVESSGFGSLTLDPASVSYGYWGSSNMVLDTDFGYLTGHLNALDAPGEWIIQDKVLYIIPPEGTDIAKDLFEYKARTLTFDLTGKSNIRISNINGVGGSVNMKDAELCMLSGCNFQYTSHFTWVADTRVGFIDKADDYSPEGAQARGEAGIYVGGADNVIRDCIIDQSAGAGLFIAGKYAYVCNNVISECGYAGTSACGIYVAFQPWESPHAQRGGHAVYFNSVYGCGRSPMTINSHSPWLTEEGKYTRYIPMDIAFNDFYNGGILSGRDGGVVYSWGVALGDDACKTKIHNNLVWDYYAYDNGHSFNVGVYYDDCTQMLESYGNVIFNTNEQAELKMQFFNHQSGPPKSINTGLFDWNRVEKGYLSQGKAGLTREDYPNGAYFRSGSALCDTGRIRPRPSDTIRYSLKDGVLSAGMRIDGDGVKPSSLEDYLQIKGVDFKDGANKAEIYFSGDYYGEKDKIQLRLDSPDGPVICSKSIKSEAPTPAGKNRVVCNMTTVSGVHDVYLRFAKIATAKVISLRPFMSAEEAAESLKISCETMDEAGKWDDSTSVLTNALADGVKDTWGGNWICFEGRSFDSAYDSVRIQYATKPPYAGNVVKIRIGSLTAEPVAVFTLEGKDWNEKIDLTAEIPAGLDQGVHDVYVTFEGAGCSSNLYEIEFMQK